MRIKGLTVRLPHDYKVRQSNHLSKPMTKFKPADVQKYIGITTVSQRERRKRGGFHYFGTAPAGGKYTFSALDMLGLAVAKHLEPKINDVFEAERCANWCVGEVAKHAGLISPQFLKILPRDVTDPNANQNLGRGFKYCLFAKAMNPIFTDNANLVADMGSDVVAVINLELIANALPAQLMDQLGAISRTDA